VDAFGTVPFTNTPSRASAYLGRPFVQSFPSPSTHLQATEGDSNETDSNNDTPSLPPVQPSRPAQGGAMSNNPLVQGEVTMDGSLLVLIPAAVIGIGGFFLSIYVGINSSDEIIEALNASAGSLEIKPRNEQSVDNSKCRGLCSSQAEDLQGLESFMQRLGGVDKKATTEAAMLKVAETSVTKEEAAAVAETVVTQGERLIDAVASP
jgi:hypothetical protein